jgi:hypothetical protein
MECRAGPAGAGAGVALAAASAPLALLVLVRASMLAAAATLLLLLLLLLLAAALALLLLVGGSSTWCMWQKRSRFVRECMWLCGVCVCVCSGGGAPGRTQGKTAGNRGGRADMWQTCVSAARRYGGLCAHAHVR